AAPADPRDLWVTTDDPDGAQSALRTVLPANSQIDTRNDPAGREVLGAAALTLWAAAICVALLALLGVSSSARARLRVGRNDLAVLRALGMRSKDQAGILSTELVVVLALGAAGGLAAGALVSALTIPYFARAAVTLPYVSISTGLRIDLLGLAVLVGALCIGAAVVVLVARRRVSALVRTAMPDGEPE
ncbi:MAG: FtsX-like permease family protein, partial [Rhodoglobus sp.]